ncbi:MAG TPA: glutathione S-transferase family protein [Alphaproteobacteria bacterium]|nr:glutathione S-transferase family protein [Alphaproteobacteria bacterium]
MTVTPSAARILYSGPLSLFSRKVEMALGEKGLAFERVMVPFSQERGYAPKHPAVLAANPKAQVPVLVDGDLTLFDSTLILEYLEDAYPAPPLFPREARARARCRRLELFADEILFAPVRLLMYRTEPPHPEREHQAAREAEGARAEAAIRGHYAGLADELGERDYFCGDFSVADIALFMTLLFAARLKGPTLGDFPNLAAWQARMRGRPVIAKVAAEIAEADRVLSRKAG